MSKKKKKSKLKLYIFGILAVLLIVGGFVGYSIYSDNLLPNIFINNEAKKFIYIYPDDDFDSVMKKIEESGNVRDMNAFTSVAKHQKYAESIKPGKYEMVNQMSNIQLVRNLKNGRQATQRITFNNIRTKQQFCDRIGEIMMFSSADLLGLLNSDSLYRKDFMKETKLNDKTIVSLFIPNTYDVYWTDSPLSFVQRMKSEYDRFWNEERSAKADSLHLTRTEVSILASIVEEETKNKKEQPTVAGLYYNRVNIGMALQADPTVKFAVGDFSIKRIRQGHLEVDSPYNTYKYPGLPPGPIRLPSINVIDAVLNLEHHKYLYMCASDKFDGTHNFAQTYDEHQVFANKYRKALNRRKIK